MPYGFPFNPRTFRCVYCRSEHLGYKPYCGNCGREQPDRDRVILLGYGPPQTLDSRWIHDNGEIKAQLAHSRGFPVRLWTYGVSHCELTLHIYDAEKDAAFIVMCGGTDMIRVGTHAWKSDLQLVQRVDGMTLLDKRADVEIHCRLVRIFFGLESPFCGV